MLQKHSIASTTMSSSWLIGPRSHLLDRFSVDCEQIFLPEREMPGGEVTFGLEQTQDPDPLSRTKGLVSRQISTDKYIFDARRGSPENWAHLLDDLLPLMLFLCDRLDIPVNKVLFVIPPKTPAYILKVLAELGIEALQSNLRPRGMWMRATVTPYRSLRAIRAQWAAAPLARAMMTPLIAQGSPDQPRRIFVSRRKTRALENEAEIEACLTSRGYETVYPEDLSVPDQLRLFRDAEDIVAIHGAGLAPMIYAQPGGRLRQLVEILPCGHMTDNFRGLPMRWGSPGSGCGGGSSRNMSRGSINLIHRI